MGWLHPPFGTFLNALFMAGFLLIPLYRLRRSFPFDIIDAHFGFPAGVAAWLLSGVFKCPFTVTLRGNELAMAQSHPTRGLMSKALRKAARVFPLSEELHQLALSLGADAKSVRKIPNGVDVSLFYSRNATDLRKKHNIPADSKVILSVGLLIRRKGHHLTIAALSRLKAKGIRPLLYIIGAEGREHPCSSQLRMQVSASQLDDQVTFLGYQEPNLVAEWIAMSDVFCSASSREGWPNAVQEALACGSPVVATRVGAIPEMIINEDYGLQVEPGNEEELAQALETALSRTWDHSAIARFGQARSWDTIAKLVLSEFRSICSEGSRP
jgi:glycosyltransferase involved in cell wall biosynthesis